MSYYSLYFKQKQTNWLNITSYGNLRLVSAQDELRVHLIEVPCFYLVPEEKNLPIQIQIPMPIKVHGKQQQQEYKRI